MKKRLKRISSLVLIGLLAFSLNGCFLWSDSSTPEEYRVAEGYYRLVADFSGGSLERELKFRDVPLTSGYFDPKTKEIVPTTENYEAAVMEIADHLSAWTGFDFTLNSATVVDGGILIDWSKQSTLLIGLDDREQIEEFRFSDAVRLNWFMMDTLATTLTSGQPLTDTVFFCSEGKDLVFANQEEMAAQGLIVLPIEEKYYGSYYYASDANEL